jgi:hypothetical protein
MSLFLHKAISNFKSKYFYFFVVYIVLSNTQLSAQTNSFNSFNFQISIRDSKGNPISKPAVSLQADLVIGTFLQYRETFSGLSTGNFGIINLQIGKGNKVSGDFPSPELFSDGNISLKIAIDTNNGANYASVFTDIIKPVPIASFAQKAPGTLNYFDNTTINNAIGISGDVAVEYNSSNAKSFPKLYFNKQNDAWPSKSYSLLANNDSSVYRTIFFKKNSSSGNEWDFNPALTMNDRGLGINMPNGSTPARGLDVYGNVRLDTLSHSVPQGKMLVVEPNGNLSNRDLPTISNILPFANNGDMLFFNGTTNNWESTPLMKFRQGRLALFNTLTVLDTVKSTHGLISSAMVFPYLPNPAPNDSIRFLTTNANGLLSLQKIKFPSSSSGNLPSGNQQGDFLFYDLPTASWQSTSNVQYRNSLEGLFATSNLLNRSAATFENTYSSNIAFERPLALETRVSSISYGIGLKVNGGRNYDNIILSGKGISSTGAVGVSSTTNVAGGLGTTGGIGGHFYTNTGQNRSVALLAQAYGTKGAALIVNEGKSGFGFPYTDGTTPNQFPNSTVDVNGTFGMKSEVIINPPSVAVSLNINLANYDASQFYLYNEASQPLSKTVVIQLPNADSVINREYIIYVHVQNNADISVFSFQTQLIDFNNNSAGFPAATATATITTNGSSAGRKIKFVSANIGTSANPINRWLMTKEELID